MIKKAAALLLIIAAGITNSCVFRQSASAVKTDINEEQTQHEPPTRAELVIRAIAQAFPDRIEKIEFRNDDWALLLRDTWYYYAEGKLLPENQIENAENYRAYQLYNYPAELPAWRTRTQEEEERLKSWTARRRQTQNQIRRSAFFLDDLWQASTRAQTEKNIIIVDFLGKRTKIHELIQDKLSNVETQIREAADNDPQLQTWINNLEPVEGYGWRNIADTQSRSLHSYGIAVDLLPKNLGRQQTYWLWTSHYRDDWWNVSYNERYHPPAAVISAFESNGFIWGGKWPLFDTMHFEYRPEILIFSGMMSQNSGN
ncbi:MAG: M15 family metallopeptidase [Treponema sp.]|nr:M15 family metallopeptidase [Treponema sp.]